tara:strand:+ start:284 stop:520 length:237 start_codon:yes stop_codon:yes gene_type:complete
MAGLDDGTWHCMTDAPKDGTTVELLVRHDYYRFCKTEEDRARWEQACTAKWIDHNGGGWMWDGIMGAHVGWRPARSNV